MKASAAARFRGGLPLILGVCVACSGCSADVNVEEGSPELRELGGSCDSATYVSTEGEVLEKGTDWMCVRTDKGDLTIAIDEGANRDLREVLQARIGEIAIGDEVFISYHLESSAAYFDTIEQL